MKNKEKITFKNFLKFLYPGLNENNFVVIKKWLNQMKINFEDDVIIDKITDDIKIIKLKEKYKKSSNLYRINLIK